jgi:hypothetical protein
MRNRRAAVGVHLPMTRFHGGDMSVVRQPARVQAAPLNIPQVRAEELAHHELQAGEAPATELADLYVAILIAVPLGFVVLRWLWP